METILLTKNDLTSGVALPADVRKVLSFIANWDDDIELALWYDKTHIMVCQPECGLWTFHETTWFRSDLIAAGVAFDYCDFVLSSEKIHCPSCDYEKHVAALCIRREYIIQ